MIEIGKFNRLTVTEHIGPGYTLTDGRDTVLLPNKLAGGEHQPGESLEVFVYTDSEDRPVATTQKPLAQVGDFACLKAVDSSIHGVFMDWGLDKDLFVPKSEQHAPMVVGRSYVVAVFLDNTTGRVAAASRLGEFFDYDLSAVKVGEEVDLLVYGYSAQGTQVIVSDRFSGLVYASEIFSPLAVGQRLKGFVSKVRDDNKLDIRLQRSGQNAQRDAESVVLHALEEAGGSLPVGDKSLKEDVYDLLGLSKKAFKAAVGSLYKAGKVEPGALTTKLTKK